MPMDTRSIAAVLLKVTGLVLIVIAISQLPAYFPLTGRGYDFSIGEVLATTALALGPFAVLGLVLWFFPGTVANRIVSSAATESAVVDIRPIELVALTILGVYLLAHGLVGAVRDTVLLIVMHRQNADLTVVPASVMAHIAATAVELVIGAGLCIGAKGVSRVIERLRR
jgi:hypothetical protein